MNGSVSNRDENTEPGGLSPENKLDKYFVPSYSHIPTPLFGRVQDQMPSAKMRTADTDYLAMLEFFSNCQAPQPFPLGSSKGVEIGDRCYLGYPGRSAIPSIALKKLLVDNVGSETLRIAGV
jgi:hypothetical protein